MRKALIALVLTGFVFLVLYQVAEADTIHLKNGGKLKGKIVRENDKEIEIEIECGSICIRKRDIKEIERAPVRIRKRPVEKAEENEKTEKVEKKSSSEAEKGKKRFLSEEEYFKQPEYKINIGEGSLIIAKHFFPNLDIQKYLDQLDAMAKELKTDLKDASEPLEIVKTINKYLYEKKKFGYRGGVHFLNVVLDRKFGSCCGLSFLYLAMAERLNLPFYGVCTPAHIFVRYDDGSTKINIEADGGIVFSDDWCIKKRGVPEDSIKNGIYMRNLSKKEVFAPYYGNSGNIYWRKGYYDESIRYSNKAITLNPRCPGAYHGRGEGYIDKGDYNKALPNYNKAISLGLRTPDPYCGRARAYLSKGNLGKAIEDFNKSVSLNPKYAEGYAYRATYYAYKKDKNAMLKDLKKALKLDPGSKRFIVKSYEAFKAWWEDEDFKKVVGKVRRLKKKPSR